MSSLNVEELISVLSHYPKDYEVVMEIKHKYDITADQGKKGWWADINGISVDGYKKIIKLIN